MKYTLHPLTKMRGCAVISNAKEYEKQQPI